VVKKKRVRPPSRGEKENLQSPRGKWTNHVIVVTGGILLKIPTAIAIRRTWEEKQNNP